VIQYNSPIFVETGKSRLSEQYSIALVIPVKTGIQVVRKKTGFLLPKEWQIQQRNLWRTTLIKLLIQRNFPTLTKRCQAFSRTADLPVYFFCFSSLKGDVLRYFKREDGDGMKKNYRLRGRTGFFLELPRFGMSSSL